ncbi:MAG: hypothetical protein ACT4OY_01290 [Alphaproteobacteria bacterium]
MKKLQKTLVWGVVASESMHVFCCVLPTIFSLLSLFAGLGLMSAMPVGLMHLHDLLHRWELPMIIVSGAILALGWALYRYSKKVDCHDTGCCHGPCGPKKNKVGLVLKAATLLFIINISVYGVFHRGVGINLPHNETMHEQADGETGH